MTNEILIVDDNSDIRKLISGILSDKGFSVREAANFDQALLEINKKLPDVAVIDVKLDKGDNDGIELLIYTKKILLQENPLAWIELLKKHFHHKLVRRSGLGMPAHILVGDCPQPLFQECS